MNRPLGVTVVAIIAALSGFFQALGSIFRIIGGLFITPTAFVGWFSLLVGLITLFVGIGLWRGSSTARVIATIVFVINAAIAVFSLFNPYSSAWSAFVSGVLAVIGLVLLYTSNANRYFHSR